MPTKYDGLELLANCYAEWTTNYDGTGKAGVIFYSCTTNATGKGYYKTPTAWKQLGETAYSTTSKPSGFVAYTLATPHIFIPTAGCFVSGASLASEGVSGGFWTSSWDYLMQDYESQAYEFMVANTTINYATNRKVSYGYPIRAVCQ